ncbi:MAG: hypothetical protein V4641_05590 [Pseudomonadota bacterium]
MSIFVQDTFTGAAGLLTSHVGELGGWINDPLGHSNWQTSDAVIDGSGFLYGSLTGTDPPTLTALSNVLAPQLDMYAEMHVNIGVQSGSGDNNIQFYAHFNTTTRYYQACCAIYFAPAYVQVFAPTGYGPGPFETDLPGVSDNSNHIIRIEYRYTTQDIKFYLDGVLVAEWGATMSGLPTVPGLFAFDIDSRSTSSGEGLRVDYLELGTFSAPPPSAFWTDYTGPIDEVL